MGFITLDIRNNQTGQTDYYTITYHNYMNGTCSVEISDGTALPITDAFLGNNLTKCFTDLKNYIATFGKIIDVHQKHLNEITIPFKDILTDPIKTIKTEIKGNCFEITYYDESINFDRLTPNYSGLIKMTLLTTDSVPDVLRLGKFEVCKNELIEIAEGIRLNNPILYDKLYILYEFHTTIKINPFDLTRMFVINLKKEDELK